MSWQHEYNLYAKCKCGKGKVKESVSGDDWGRSDSLFLIECPDCAQNYHIEVRSVSRPDGELISYQYMVRNGESIHYPSFDRVSFLEDVCASFTINSLICAKEEIASNTSLAAVKGGVAKRIIQIHRRWYKPTKISDVADRLYDAIGGYALYTHNKEAVDAQSARLLSNAGDYLRFSRR